MLILDLKLSEGTGFEILQWMEVFHWVRRRVRRPKIGVLTCSTDPADKQKAYDLGADVVEIKNWDDATLNRFLQWLRQLSRIE